MLTFELPRVFKWIKSLRFYFFMLLFLLIVCQCVLHTLRGFFVPQTAIQPNRSTSDSLQYQSKLHCFFIGMIFFLYMNYFCMLSTSTLLDLILNLKSRKV